jgi:V-type H+-transporting ATPase subunit a
MINNFLQLGTQDVYWFPGQKGINVFLLIAVFLAIPMMLCVKPCAHAYCCKPHHDSHEDEENFDKIDAENADKHVDGDKNIDESDSAAEIRAYEKLLKAEHGPQGVHGTTFGDLFIHQMIETIEFVLGAVSNTASYLRLWALSLAHSQLAEVFLSFGLAIGWSGKNSDGVPATNTSLWSITFMTFILWFAYMAVTWGVLMMMDVLECFLHTLRLHWVEFQNKFYSGTGYLYTPFRFKDTFEAEMARK